MCSSIWDISIGEQFECAREPLNDSDQYAVAVIKDSVTIGHLPRKIIASLLIIFT